MTLRTFALVVALWTGSANAEDPAIATLQEWLSQPEGNIDLAHAKVALDHAIDPSIDIDATLREVGEWVARVRARFPPDANNGTRLELLLSTLYEPGPWNNHRPFTYDYTDPRDSDVRNTFLSTYLERRTGQCVVMPIALVVIGQKLGLPVTLTTAPYHVLVKYGDDVTSQWRNIEATSGRLYFDSQYEQSLRIPPEAIEQGTFLRPYTQRESVALFATTALLPFFQQQRKPERTLHAANLILGANPDDVVAMTYQGDAWYAKARASGWRAWTSADWTRYGKLFNQRKAESTATDEFQSSEWPADTPNPHMNRAVP